MADAVMVLTDEQTCLSDQQRLQRKGQFDWQPSLALKARPSPGSSCKCTQNAFSAGAGVRSSKVITK